MQEFFRDTAFGLSFTWQPRQAYSTRWKIRMLTSNLPGRVHECTGGMPPQRCKHLIYASSSSVYGANVKQPFSIHDRVDNPVSLYAATKKANKLMAHAYSHLYHLPTTGLRFFTVYRPWGRPDMAYFLFTKAIIERKPIELFNHGKMRRDFTYIDDVVDAVQRIVEGDAPASFPCRSIMSAIINPRNCPI